MGPVDTFNWAVMVMMVDSLNQTIKEVLDRLDEVEQLVDSLNESTPTAPARWRNL